VAKTYEEVREGVIAEYKKNYDGERLFGKVFSVYILDRYVKLLLRIYKKAEQKQEGV